MDRAMNAGAEAVGGDSNWVGEFPGRTVRSYNGVMVATVQFMLAALFAREQDPNTPIKTLGPSIPFDGPGCVNAVEGKIMRSAT